MFNLFHKLYDNLIFRKPSVQYIAPKTLNVYFKNAIKPQYQLLNLQKYDRFTLETQSFKEGENNLFKLFLVAHIDNLNEVSSKEIVIELAKFESRKEADDALVVLKNKLFSPEKTGIKFILTTATIFIVIMFLLNLFYAGAGTTNPNYNTSGLSPQMIQQLQQQQQATAQMQATDPTKAYEALQQARQQADKIMADGTRNQNASPIPVQAKETEVPQDSTVQDFVKGLGK